jgi:hypothetical protein
MSASAAVCSEGVSLADVVRAPETAKAKDSAFYQWRIGSYTSYTIVTKLPDSSHVRYSEWVTAKNYTPVWSTRVATELYNLTADLEENKNIAKETDPQIVARLSKMLHAGWRGGM